MAQLNCGIEVMRRGLVDHLGLQVGATGKQVIERTHALGGGLVCTPWGQGVGCFFEPAGQEEQPIARYLVPKSLPSGAVLRGEAAERFFARQRIRSFHMTVYCH